MIRKKTNKVNVKPLAEKEAENDPGSLWSKVDRGVLRQGLDPLKNVQARPLGFLYAPEATGLLATDKEFVFERTTAVLIQFNVVAGLVLSSIIGGALDPIVVETLPADKVVLGNVYNIVALVAVTIQTCLTMYSTFLLVMVFGMGSNLSMLYRFVAYSGPVLSLMMVASFMPNMGIFAMIGIKVYLASSDQIGLSVIVVMVMVVIFFHLFFINHMSKMLPLNMWTWVAMGAPWKLFSSRLREDAARLGQVVAADAEKSILAAGLDKDHDGHIDDIGAVAPAITAAETEMEAWITEVLPDLGKMRVKLVIDGLLAEGLSRDNLETVGRQFNGFQILMGMLEFEENDQLSQGERIALATSVMPDVRKEIARF